MGDRLHVPEESNNEANITSLVPLSRSTMVTCKPIIFQPTMKGQEHNDITLTGYNHHQHSLVDSSINRLSFMQYSMALCIREFGDKGRDAVVKELLQLHQCGAFQPILHSVIEPQLRDNVLESHLFLDKRDDDIKARLVAGGDKQRHYTSSVDVSSPTCTHESIVLSAVIDAKENMDVAIVDIPNAFIQTPVRGIIYICMRGQLEELMISIDVKHYGGFRIVTSNGKILIYLRFLKALYGVIPASHIFYYKLANESIDEGFVITPMIIL